MSHGVRPLSLNGILQVVRPPLQRVRQWCEWIALLAAVGLTYTRLRWEIGDWQALLVSAGVPMAVIEGPRDRRLLARRVSRRLRDAFAGLSRPGPDTEAAPGFWVSLMPHGIVISGATKARSAS